MQNFRYPLLRKLLKHQNKIMRSSVYNNFGHILIIFMILLVIVILLNFSSKIQILQTKYVHHELIDLYKKNEQTLKQGRLGALFLRMWYFQAIYSNTMSDLEKHKTSIVISRNGYASDSHEFKSNILKERSYSLNRTLSDSDIQGVVIDAKNSYVFSERARLLLWSSMGSARGALVWSLVYGSQESMPEDIRAAFLSTGTLHLAALSGSNVSTWLLLIKASTQAIKKRSQKTSLLLVSLFCYGLMVQTSPGIVRALVQAGLQLCGQLLGRKVHKIQTLFLALILTCLFHIDWISDVGLWLSFCSSFALIAQKRADEQRVGAVASVVRELQASVLCTWATAPIILVIFKRISCNGIVFTPLISLFTLFFSAFGLGITFCVYLLSYLTWSGAVIISKLVFELPVVALEQTLRMSSNLLPFDWVVSSNKVRGLLVALHFILTALFLLHTRVRQNYQKKRII